MPKFEPHSYVNTKQLATFYPAFSLSTLKGLSLRNHPACIRIQTRPGNKRCLVIWNVELFELWIQGNSESLGTAIEERRDAIRAYLDSLTKRGQGRPRGLKIAGGRG
ncbi:MAG: hypothetical protein ACREN0_07365 [Thermodesulfobacteriota bacterium]